MVFYLVGLGLGSEKDITVRGLEIVKGCSKVLLESYTAVLPSISAENLSKFYGREVIVATREMVEQGSDEFLEEAKESDVALLVVGDPFGATTHTDLVTRCKAKGVKVDAVHNASIMNAVGCCGLQLYNFGRTVSIVFFTEKWRPDSFYPKIATNVQVGLHTLLLLDIKVREQSEQNMILNKKVFEPPRFMTVNQCVSQLIEVEERHGKGVCGKDSYGVGVARVGHESETVVYGTLEQLEKVDFGGPLHSLVLVGETDEIEQQVLDAHKVTAATPMLPEGSEAAAVPKAAELEESTKPTLQEGEWDPDAWRAEPKKMPKEVAEAYRTYSDDGALGKDAPALDTLEYIQGGPVAYSSDKPTVIVFWAKFAKGDYTTVVGVSEICDDFKEQAQFLGVSVDPNVDDAKSFLKKIGTAMPELDVKKLVVPYALAFDAGKAVKNAFMKACGLNSLGASATFIVDKKGKILWREQFGQGYAPKKGQLREQLRRHCGGEGLLSNGKKPVEEEDDEDLADGDMDCESYTPPGF